MNQKKDAQKVFSLRPK